MLNGEILLPIDEFVADLGLESDKIKVDFNSSGDTASISQGSKNIRMKLSEDIVYVNDVPSTMSTAPVKYKEKLYVPAKQLAENLGKKVIIDYYGRWNETNRLFISISDKQTSEKASEIINKAYSTMQSVSKYTIESVVKYTDGSGTQGVHQIDNQKKRGYLKKTSIDIKNKNSDEYELLGENSEIKSKENNSTIWEKIYGDNNFYILVSPFGFLKDEKSCFSIISKDMVKNQLIVNGLVMLKDPVNAYMFTEEYFAADIIIDANTYYIKEIALVRIDDGEGNVKKNLNNDSIIMKVSNIESQINVKVNGKLLEFDVPPIITEGRTLVPFRKIFEALGGKVEWNEETRTIVGIKGNTKIQLQIDNKIAKVNDKELQLEVPATIIDERTLVPLRFIAESLNADVSWDEASRTVIIINK